MMTGPFTAHTNERYVTVEGALWIVKGLTWCGFRVHIVGDATHGVCFQLPAVHTYTFQNFLHFEKAGGVAHKEDIPG
jgi:hypothetical protein